MYIQFLRDRITQLRLQKGVSEYQMSLPSVEGLFEICDYFGLTPAQFFDESVDDPALVAEAVKGLRQLSDSDKLLILNHINRLTHG